MPSPTESVLNLVADAPPELPAAQAWTGWRVFPMLRLMFSSRSLWRQTLASRVSDSSGDRYRAAGWDIGSGMVESACKHLIAAREKGAGMRWSEAGAHTVAAVRVLLANEHGLTDDLAA